MTESLSGCAFLWRLERWKFCTVAEVLFYIPGFKAHLEPQPEGQKGQEGDGWSPHRAAGLPPPQPQARSRAEALHRDVCRRLWAPFRPSQTDASNLGCTEATSAEQKKVLCSSSRETKALGRNLRDTALYWSEQEHAGKRLGESTNGMCPFITEKLRNFGCPPKV